MKNCYFVSSYIYSINGSQQIGYVLKNWDFKESKDPNWFFKWVLNEIMEMEPTHKVYDVCYKGHHFKYIGLEPGFVFTFMRDDGVTKRFALKEMNKYGGTENE